MYCRILSEVIKTAKKSHYDKLITNSNNKVKTIWDIVKTGTSIKNKDGVSALNIDGKTIKDHQNS